MLASPIGAALADHGLVTRALIAPAQQIPDFRGTNAAEENNTMRSLAVGILLGLALTVQAFALIRSPFPAKPMPPSHGHVIVIDDDAKLQGTVTAPK
jgi:hypothetical protein